MVWITSTMKARQDVGITSTSGHVLLSLFFIKYRTKKQISTAFLPH